MNIKKIILFSCALCIMNCALLYPVDFSLNPGGFMFFPRGEGNANANGAQRYNNGGGAAAGLEVDISSILSNPLGIGYTLGIEGNMLISPYFYGDDSLNFYSFSGNAGLYYYPLSRLFLSTGAGIGVYTANDGYERGKTALTFNYGGEAGFRFNPNFTLTANAGWRQYQIDKASRPLSSGVYAGLGLRFTFELGESSSGGAGASLDQYDAVYPVLTPLYQKFPVGSITVKNNENAEIRNVRIYFRAGNYTVSEYPCGEAGIIPKGRSIEIPLYADFSPDVLRFADSGRILGEIVIRYVFLGVEREALQTVNIAVNNRNTPVPGDNSALAAFVSTGSAEILLFSKYAASLARNNHRTGLNNNMETGIWLFEAIRQTINIKQGSGEVQFPGQTLAYGTGSILDIALLYAASLQTAGISAAIVIMPDDEVITAFSLGISRDDPETSALFSGYDKLLIVHEEVWLPVLVSGIDNGFTGAWQQALNRINNLNDTGKTAEMIIVEEAWTIYPPAPFPSLGIRLTLPQSAEVDTASNTVVQSYIASEFTPRIASIQRQIQSNPNGALYNQLGNLYMRSGQTVQAKSAYERAANMGYTGAMVNRANVALNENNITEAERWFNQALSRDSSNRAAQRGLEYIEARK